MSSVETATFGDLLRRWRKAAGLTQAELAERAGLSPRGVNDLERGARRTPRKDTALLLADALRLADADRAAFLSAARRHPPDLPALSADAASSASPTPAGEVAPSTEQAPAPSMSSTPAAPAPPPLPSGTVTFLFSDIEASTQTLQRVGAPTYARLLAESQTLLRAVWRAHAGAEVDTAGDSFFVAFATAPDAVAAAAEAIQALSAHPWPAGGALHARLGLHTGAPLLVGDHYVGFDVHKAARIAAAGHGGQALLSQATCDLVEDALPEGVSLRDLGAHRLKDLQRPERLHQLVLRPISGAPGEEEASGVFPPLRTLDRHAHNLPIQPTALLGRERELEQVGGWLRTGAARLVTLTGPGGVGKTRLSLRLAAELVDAYPDGVWFVRLARLSEPALVVPTIAETLGLKELGGQPLAVTLREWLRPRAPLLVLDNFEHVLAAAPAVGALLEDSPGLRLLVTSRAPLRLRGERETPIAPLPLPPRARRAQSAETLEGLTHSPAVALFLQRAREAWPAFALTDEHAAVVAAICARLDGLPLALELAARWVKLLPPPALLKRLEQSLPALTGGARDAEERQQTMRATLGWSDGLLRPAERRLFHRLAVFAGGWSLEAAEAVCAAPDGAPPLGMDVLEGLAALSDHSLVQAQPTGEGDATEPRFRTLYVVREYALERLQADGAAGVEDVEALRRAHAEYYVDYAEEMAPRRMEPGWRARMEQDLDNVRAALTWARERGELAIGLRLSLVFGQLETYPSEHRSWLESFLHEALNVADDARSGVPRDLLYRALIEAGQAAMWGGDGRAALGWAERILELDDEMGDARLRASALEIKGTVAALAGDHERAISLLEQSRALFLEAGNEGQASWVMVMLGIELIYLGDLNQAETLLTEAIPVGQRTDHMDTVTIGLGNLADVALRRGDIARAEALARDALGVSHEFILIATAANLAMLVWTASAAGQAMRAARLHGAELALREVIGFPLVKAEMAEIERWLASARAALGEEAWAAGVAAGRELTLQEAIAEALGPALGDPPARAPED